MTEEIITCKECGKRITEGDFCSEECLNTFLDEAYKNQLEEIKENNEAKERFLAYTDEELKEAEEWLNNPDNY